MTLVFAAIAPHGGLVFDNPEGETRRGMEELRRRFTASASFGPAGCASTALVSSTTTISTTAPATLSSPTSACAPCVTPASRRPA